MFLKWLNTFKGEIKFFIHDPEPILAEQGGNIKITFDYLKQISNEKGLVIFVCTDRQFDNLGNKQ